MRTWQSTTSTGRRGGAILVRSGVLPGSQGGRRLRQLMRFHAWERLVKVAWAEEMGKKPRAGNHIWKHDGRTHRSLKLRLAGKHLNGTDELPDVPGLCITLSKAFSPGGATPSSTSTSTDISTAGASSTARTPTARQEQLRDLDGEGQDSAHDEQPPLHGVHVRGESRLQCPQQTHPKVPGRGQRPVPRCGMVGVGLCRRCLRGARLVHCALRCDSSRRRVWARGECHGMDQVAGSS